MKFLQSSLSIDGNWSDLPGSLEPLEASLVFAFGQRALISHDRTFDAVRERFPSARLVFVSTAGNFADTHVDD